MTHSTIGSFRTDRKRVRFLRDGSINPITLHFSQAQGHLPSSTYRKEKANQLRNRLRGLGYTAKEYIGSSGSFHRKDVLHEFKQNQLQWVVGTSAFGMGVDKDDVWVVGYLGIPSSLKELYQSFGRAARFDDWGFNEHRKNGYCKGILIDKQQSSNRR